MNHLADIAGRSALRWPIASLALAGLLAGCGLGADVTPLMTYTCGTVPAEACHEQAEILKAAATGPVRTVALTCVGSCTRAKGAGDATVTLSDRTSSTHTWSYAGDTNPPPTLTCVSLAKDVCLLRVQELTGNVSPSHHLASVTVTCHRTCDALAGEVLVVFLSEGGVRDEMGTTWGDPQP